MSHRLRSIFKRLFIMAARKSPPSGVGALGMGDPCRASLAACAIRREIGVDIELARDDVDGERSELLAERFFSPKLSCSARFPHISGVKRFLIVGGAKRLTSKPGARGFRSTSRFACGRKGRRNQSSWTVTGLRPGMIDRYNIPDITMCSYG